MPSYGEYSSGHNNYRFLFRHCFKFGQRSRQTMGPSRCAWIWINPSVHQGGQSVATCLNPDVIANMLSHERLSEW